jgi:hypothetical protein
VWELRETYVVRDDNPFVNERRLLVCGSLAFASAIEIVNSSAPNARSVTFARWLGLVILWRLASPVTTSGLNLHPGNDSCEHKGQNQDHDGVRGVTHISTITCRNAAMNGTSDPYQGTLV